VQITRRAGNDWTEVVIEGRLDGYWAEHLDAGLAEAVRDGQHRLRLDLAAVPFLSSAGIAVLVKYYKRLGAIHGALVIAAVSPQVKSVLDMTRLTSMLTTSTTSHAPQTLTVGAAFISHGVVCQLFEVQTDGRMRCRVFGHDGEAVGSNNAARSERLACSAYGIHRNVRRQVEASHGHRLQRPAIAICRE